MRDYRILHSRAQQQVQFGTGRRGLWRATALAAVLSLFVMSSFVAAQDGGEAPLVQMDGADGGAPVTNMGGGDFFSQELGTIFRLRYSTESYGQDEQGNFDIGTMQVTNFDDATAFFDGQVTVNEQQGVGFNLGLGYRSLAVTPFAVEPERVNGVSLWADGTNTKGGDFFPQVGVSFESLGDLWDMRLNGYIPLGARTKTGSFASTGVVGFAGNNIVDATVADQHTSFDVAELEFARRLGNDRDAWFFAGPYVLANQDDDSAGWKVGVRGYAYPDLLLQFAVSQDDIFQTNAAFSLTWFVGRTRTNFQPACGLPDRMREPVLRNDYVALSKTIIHSGTPLTDTNGNPFNVVHVDSNAPPGGDGTIEHPLNNVADVFAHSVAGNLQTTPNTPGSIIDLHANSTFTGQGTLVLQTNQRLLGEGANMKFFVDSQQHGPNTLIPESSPGARAGNVPVILDALGDAVALSDTNEVANFTINGGTRGIVPSSVPMMTGAGNPNIHDVTIKNTTGDGIVLTPFVRDNDGLPATPQKTVAFNVTLNNLTFDNVGGNDISIDATPPGGIVLPDPNVTLQEAMAISNINSTNGHGRGIFISNTHTGGTETISSYSHDGGTTSTEALVFANAAGTATVNTSTFIGGQAIVGDTGGVLIDTSTGNFTFADTVTFTQLNGGAVKLNGNTAGTVMFQGDIANTPAVDVDSILLTNNTGQDINFNGNLTLTATGSGKAFSATGGGTLTTTGTNNVLSSQTGTALEISNMTLSNAGVTIHKLNAGTASAGPVSGIILTNNTGGPITVGDTTAMAGDTGTIQHTTGDAIVITNSANTSIHGFTINNADGMAGVHVTKNTTGTQTTNLGDINVTGGVTGVDVTGGGTTAGALNMTLADTNVTSPTTTGLAFNDVDSGTIAVNNVKVDGGDVTAASGVSIVGSNATFTFDSSTAISGVNGTAFSVNGGTTGTITYNGSIATTAAAASPLEVQNRTGGSVVMSPTSTITETGAGGSGSGGTGISIHDNSGGSVLVQGTNMLTPAANSNGITLTNNTGASITLAGLTIAATGTGGGLIASGGGTLEVDGTTNTITAVNGVGLSISDMTIANAGANFQKVDVTSGNTNGIVLTNLTGGQVTIGSSTGASGSGGSLTTTNEAVLITNAQNVDLNHIHITAGATQGVSLTQNSSATSLMDITMNDLVIDAAAGAGNGIVAVANSSNAFNVRINNSTVNDNVLLTGTGTGTFGLLVDNSDITTSGTTNAFDVELSGAARLANLVIRNGSTFTTGDANALLINSSGATTKTVNLSLDGTGVANTFTNASATKFATDLLSQGGTTFNATVQGNTFDNATTPADDFDMKIGTSTARVLLSLGGASAVEKNTATGVGGTFVLDNNAAGTFNVFDKADVITVPTFNNGTILPLPNAGAIGNSATPPIPPSAP